MHEALEMLVQGQTAFIIAHRLSSVERVIEEGTHHQLLARRGLSPPSS
jgi:ABC-type multidrug transport system fused ATPase/permease subunit